MLFHRGFLILPVIFLLSACGKPKEISYASLVYESQGAEGFFKDPETGKGFTGLAKDHDKKGNLIAEFHFKNGKFDGVVKEWYASGQAKSETTFKDGKRSGKNIEWKENGDVYNERVYDGDRIVSEKKPGAN